MSEVRAATGAGHLDPAHAVCIVFVSLDRVSGSRQPEAWPTASGIELLVGGEQGGVTGRTVVHPRVVIVQENSGKGARSVPFSRMT